jgi:hypothetical protein
MGESRHRDRRGPRRHHPLRRRLCGLGGDLLPGGRRVREWGVHAVRPLATGRAALVRNTRRRASRRPEHLRVWIGRALSLLPASASGHSDGARRARTGSIGREARPSPRSPEPWQRPAVDRTDAAIALVFFALAVSPAVATPLIPGTIVVVDVAAFGGNGGVIGVDPLTGAQTTISSGGNFILPVALTLDATGNILVADSDDFGGQGGIIRVDPVTGAKTTVSAGGFFDNPRGIALNTAGTIFIADSGSFFGGPGKVIRVDPVTGAQTVVSSGGNFEFSLALAIDAAGQILVADASAFGVFGGVIRVDPLTGVKTRFHRGAASTSRSGLRLGSRATFWLPMMVAPMIASYESIR